VRLREADRAVREALESSTDPQLQAMAKGWRFYKATEPGPGNSVLYVFVVDPTVPGEDYGLGRVLSSGLHRHRGAAGNLEAVYRAR
jgi:hypothetical protein